MTTATPEFTAGQEVIWTGTQNLFARRVRIAGVRFSYLQIFGETPADAKAVYDIADLVIETTGFGIPGEQLHAVEPRGGGPMATPKPPDDAAVEYGLLMTGGVEIKSNLSPQDISYLIRDGFRVLRRRVIVVEGWAELSAEDAKEAGQ